jgi:O-antigen ligase
MLLATGLYLTGVFLFTLFTRAFFGVSGQSLAYGPLSAALLVLVYLGLTRGPRNFLEQWYTTSPTIVPGFLFLTGLAISVPNARDVGLAAKDFLRWSFVWLAFAPATRAICGEERRCRLLAQATVVFILLFGGLAVGDLFAGGRVTARLLGHPGISAQGRYESVYENAGIFAGMLNVAFPLALVAALAARRWVSKVLWAVGTAVIVVAMLLSGTRATIAAALVAGVIVFAVRRQWWAVGLLIAIVAGMLAFAQTPLLEQSPTLTRVHDLMTGRGSGLRSMQRRLLIWSVALDLVQKHPFFGFGGSQLRYLQHAGFNRAHNAWLDAWLDGGLLSALAMALIAYLVLRRTWQTLWGRFARYRDPTHVALVAASCAVLVGWLVRAGIGSRIDWLPIFLLFSLCWERTAHERRGMWPGAANTRRGGAH